MLQKGTSISPSQSPSKAWIFFALAAFLLLFALWVELPMWLVELGWEEPAAGGGEYLLALMLGLPASFLASLFFGVGLVWGRRSKHSFLFWGAFLVSLVPLLWFVFLILKDLR